MGENEGKKSEGQATRELEASVSGCNTKGSTCTNIDQIDAIILYPSLGAPQLLHPTAKECTLLIATDAAGRAVFNQPHKAAVTINHQLYLTNLETDKATLTPVNDHKLYKDLDDNIAKEATKANVQTAQSFIEVRKLEIDLASGGSGILSLEGRAIGRLSADARHLYRDYHEYYAITLKQLPAMSTQIGAAPQSWYWIVGATLDHLKACAASATPATAQPLPITKQKDLHQTGDRLLDGYLRSLCAEANTTQGPLQDLAQLYEVDVNAEKESYKPVKKDPSRRVQLWHPVMTLDNIFKFGHLTDIHINIRQESMARSRARVIEDEQATGRHFEPVGPRVAHSYRSFKKLIDEMKAKGADILILTGDYVDFNRNLDPDRTKGDNIGQLWKKFNVLATARDPKGPYKRGMDHLCLYSLLMNALRNPALRLPAFMVSGNHEGYQMPYGISPRLDVPFGWAASLNSVVGREKKVLEQMRDLELREDQLIARERELNEELSDSEEKESDSASRLEQRIDNREQQIAVTNATRNVVMTRIHLRKEYEKILTDLTDIRSQIEKASKFIKDKANEGIPADHNLTMYEACLAYGPSYGQLWSSFNFKPEQFDLFHLIFSPFSDLNVYPLCEHPTGQAAKGHMLSLLGWGNNERYVTDIPGILKNTVTELANDRHGKDQRGNGFLPYAPASFDAAQLALLGAAYGAQVNQASPNTWTVASHFTIASYADQVPLNTTVAEFKPANMPQTNPFQFSEKGAQYDVYNWGGCERNLKTYLRDFINVDSTFRAGKVTAHFSGHTHRAGVYTLKWNKDHIQIGCKDPAITPPKPATTYAGTRFIVSTSAGSFGKQCLPGWDGKAFGLNDLVVVRDQDKAFLGGWFARPPGGYLTDQFGNNATTVSTLRHKTHNEVPRLAVMLDYRYLMSQREFRPFGIGEGNLLKGLPMWLSSEMQAMQCLKLDDITLWVFKKGEGGKAQKAGGQEETDAKPKTAKPTGQWLQFKATLVPVKRNYIVEFFDKPVGRYTLSFQDPKALLAALESRGSLMGTQLWLSTAAFLDMGLSTPKAPGFAPWHEVRCDDEHWVFPVIVSHRHSGESSIQDRIYRDEGELGEVPNWEFLKEYFGDKGYISVEKALFPEWFKPATPAKKKA
jgi:predicted MPP superfamily phosphohydrolase